MEYIQGTASFVGRGCVKVSPGDTCYTADKILIAVGGRPAVPENVPGAYDLGITSDGFFELDQLPK